jgi:hypothetical protein
MYEVVVIVFEAGSEVESYRESYGVYSSMERALSAQISACVEYSEAEELLECEVIIVEL